MTIKTYIDTELVKAQKSRSQLPANTPALSSDVQFNIGRADGLITVLERVGQVYEVESRSSFDRFIKDNANKYTQDGAALSQLPDAYKRGFFSSLQAVFAGFSKALDEKRFEPSREEFAQSLGFADELDLYLFHNR